MVVCVWAGTVRYLSNGRRGKCSGITLFLQFCLLMLMLQKLHTARLTRLPSLITLYWFLWIFSGKDAEVRELIASVENFEPQVSSETKETGEELETTSTQQEMAKLDELVWYELLKHMELYSCLFNRIDILLVQWFSTRGPGPARKPQKMSKGATGWLKIEYIKVYYFKRRGWGSTMDNGGLWVQKVTKHCTSTKS